MILCQTCTQCLQDLREDRNIRHTSVETFLAAVEVKCSFCTGLFEQLSPEQQQELFKADEDALSENEYDHFCCSHLTFQVDGILT